MARYGNHAKYSVKGYDLSLTPLSKFPNKDYKNYKEATELMCLYSTTLQ